ncbi:hypothetical protein CWB99_23430 [Pseudoalteromonas rubra]|uniref:Uncharacterized protein n=1 Tax=Pseudoalteromonas rubra TaxID=43658 RepID=A0A5S3WER7_9GAMM|nr:hypothetical protein [Pseudoalteromonas rubra]TMP23335.1 hypothetical protein CWB99_23430 [Pseudoalteromonas rubra]TMP27161.1 hypothetical protein CWC00_23560 [Pseudoalteromonas rubra]
MLGSGRSKVFNLLGSFLLLFSVTTFAKLDLGGGVLFVNDCNEVERGVQGGVTNYNNSIEFDRSSLDYMNVYSVEVKTSLRELRVLVKYALSNGLKPLHGIAYRSKRPTLNDQSWQSLASSVERYVTYQDFNPCNKVWLNKIYMGSKHHLSIFNMLASMGFKKEDYELDFEGCHLLKGTLIPHVDTIYIEAINSEL